MSQTGTNFNRQQSSKSIMNKQEMYQNQHIIGTVIDSSRPQTANILNTNMQM
jgi:hypothetical protein